MVATLPVYLRDFAQFAYLAGWRKGELPLFWSDVERDAGAIRLWRSRQDWSRPDCHVGR